MVSQLKPISKRLAVKELQVVEQLRQRIISGQLSLGSRLQPRRELEERFNVSSVTIQRALNQLVSDGFVRVRGPNGTFVAENPPHLCRYGLVFPYRPSESHPWRRFWTALWSEAMCLEQSHPLRVPVYYETQRRHSGDADHEVLASDVRSHRLAGLIFVTVPNFTAQEPILTRPDLPRVIIGATSYPNSVGLAVDMKAFFERAIDDLAARGRRRIAVLTVPNAPDWGWEQWIGAALSKHGMETKPFWTQMVHQDHAAYARNAAHVLFHPDQGERPDGLLVVDDNLLEYAAMGLLDAGVRVPDELDVVAHCNHPWPTPSVIPCRRLGFDAREAMRLAMQCIDHHRAHGSYPAGELVQPMFEDET